MIHHGKLEFVIFGDQESAEYRQINVAYTAAKEGILRSHYGMENVDKDLLLVRLFGELKKEHPKAAKMILEEHGFAPPAKTSVSPPRKKNKGDGDFSPFETTCPKELIPLIASFLSRVDSNNFEETSKSIRKLLSDPKLFSPRFPTKCPFPETPDKLIFLGERHFGVFEKGAWSDDYFESGHLQVWSRDHGLLAVLETLPYMKLTPAISPNGKYLVLKNRLDPHDGFFGVSVYKLPMDGSRGVASTLESETFTYRSRSKICLLLGQ